MIPNREDIICGDDGYFVFWPAIENGYFTANILRGIADYLDSLNAEWDAIVQGDMNES